MLFTDMYKFDVASVYRTSKSFESKFALQTATETRVKTSYKFCYFLNKYKIANNAIDEQINLIDVNTKGSLR